MNQMIYRTYAEVINALHDPFTCRCTLVSYRNNNDGTRDWQLLPTLTCKKCRGCGRAKTCPTCEGAGMVPGSQLCNACYGCGKVPA